jgi:hypothetical protein
MLVNAIIRIVTGLVYNQIGYKVFFNVIFVLQSITAFSFIYTLQYRSTFAISFILVKMLYGIGFVTIKQMINDLFLEKGKIAMTILYSFSSVFVTLSMVYYKIIVNHVNYKFLLFSYGVFNILGVVPLFILIMMERNKNKSSEEASKPKEI